MNHRYRIVDKGASRCCDPDKFQNETPQFGMGKQNFGMRPRISTWTKQISEWDPAAKQNLHFSAIHGFRVKLKFTENPHFFTDYPIFFYTFGDFRVFIGFWNFGIWITWSPKFRILPSCDLRGLQNSGFGTMAIYVVSEISDLGKLWCAWSPKFRIRNTCDLHGLINFGFGPTPIYMVSEISDFGKGAFARSDLGHWCIQSRGTTPHEHPQAHISWT